MPQLVAEERQTAVGLGIDLDRDTHEAVAAARRQQLG